MTKLAQGRLDLHSKRGSADMAALAEWAGDPRVGAANTVAEAFAMYPALGDRVASGAWETAAGVLRGSGVALEVVVFDRDGGLRGRAGFAAV
jgi:cobalt-precorrin-5B (C1)-methyltransferase